MIEVLHDKLKVYPLNEDKYNFLREYLQTIILKIIDEKGYFKNLSFVGGTALRILFQLNRFSEDLDFCLTNSTNYQFSEMMLSLERELNLMGLMVNIHYKDKKTVASAFVKFDHLLFELNLSPHTDKKLSIKFEVDQNPPLGYVNDFTMLNNDFLIGINHFDLPTLFSGKLHALLCRKYTKGRDFYDFIWYIGKKIKPNYEFLNQAILQTEKKDLTLDHALLIQLLKERFAATDFKHVINDVRPFLINSQETRFLDKNIFFKMAEDI